MGTDISFEKQEDDPPDSSLLKKERFLIKESPKKIGSFFVAKNILIKPEIRENGIKINVGEVSFSIIFPKETWEKYPQTSKKILSENLTFTLTLHLPYLLGAKSLKYQMPEPIIKNIIEEGFKLSLPATAFLKSQKTSELLKKFSKIEYHFNGKENSILDPRSKKSKNLAVLPFTFGKDSLLTYGLCQEIGIETVPVYVKEPITQWENYHKEKLARRFFEEFKKKILFIDNEAGELREPDWSFNDRGWYGWELQLTQFGLMLLPIAFSKQARYILFANEQSCNDKFLDEEGFWCNPVYEQSSDWTLKLGQIAQFLGMEELKTGSLVEPLHDLSIIKILHSRYPKIAKYQMSCGENTPELRYHRWCGNCSKCARIYILCLANNINPKKIEMPNNMLELKYKSKFALFNGKEKGYGYDATQLGRDEQLLAFLLAYRNGYKGDLIDFFKKMYLKEAEKREKELREKFFGIHSTKTVPAELRKKVLKIYRQELQNLI